jgi:hypothetical protein
MFACLDQTNQEMPARQLMSVSNLSYALCWALQLHSAQFEFFVFLFFLFGIPAECAREEQRTVHIASTNATKELQTANIFLIYSQSKINQWCIWMVSEQNFQLKDKQKQFFLKASFN